MSVLAVDNFKPSAGGTEFNHSGVAKVLCAYNQIANTLGPTTNVASVTDSSAGRYIVIATSVFDNAAAIGVFSADSGQFFTDTTITTAAFGVSTRTSGSVYQDYANNALARLGALA